MKKLILLSLVFFLLVPIFPGAHSSESYIGWKAGTARVVITPQQPIWMAGYASRDRPSEGTIHDLWAKALVLEDSNGKRVVLISTDLVGIRKNLSESIRNQLEKQFGLTRAQIILNSSHTHTGPQTESIGHMYQLDSKELNKIDSYAQKLDGQIVNLVGRALRSLQPVKLYSGNGVARFQVNRRNNTEATLSQQIELKGPNDYAVPVIKVVNDKGEMMAIAFGYACHNTVLSGYKWSGDYAGFAQLELEKQYPGATALFFQGAGADQNPLPRRTVALAEQYGKTLAAAVNRVLNEEMKPLSSKLSVAYSEVNLRFEKPSPTMADLKKIMEESSNYPDYLKHNAKVLLKKLENGETLITSYPYPVQVWKLGEQPLIALGGELVIGYAIELKRIFGQNIFVLGYNNDVMAYIPTSIILREGGYEGERSPIFTTPWASDIEKVIISEVGRLAEQAGIPLTGK